MTRLFPTRILCAASFTALAVLSCPASWAQGSPDLARPYGKSEPIPGRYIVVFKNSVANPRAEADDAVRTAGGRRGLTFTRALKGFSAELSEVGVEKLRRDPRVDYIEQDRTISLNITQGSATWGLDRIDQVDRPIDGGYTYNRSGAGVTAFIIDTGIRADHTEFTGRMLPGFSAVADANGTNDCNGHGTHVAGTVGGTTWGVAKDVTLVPVRVLNCQGSGTNSGVIAGIDWVAGHASRPAVANMSLGGSLSSALNAAVARAVAQGVTMVVAAGNENTDACRKSPASEPSAITVGATTSADARASFSNFGTCVDIFAPGLNITSAWHSGASATNTISGTSMASPHAAGVAALALEANPTASPIAVTDFLIANASRNKLSSLGSGSPNRLLFSTATGAPAEPQAPTIAISALAGKGIKVSRNWKAQVTVTVRNVATNELIVNATVTGEFAPGGSASCLTTSTGTCTMSSEVILSTYPTTVFTVTGASANGMNYDSGQNSASQITVNRR